MEQGKIANFADSIRTSEINGARRRSGRVREPNCFFCSASLWGKAYGLKRREIGRKMSWVRIRTVESSDKRQAGEWAKRITARRDNGERQNIPTS